MDDLLRSRAKTAEAAARRGRRKRKKNKTVAYTTTGKAKRGKLPVWAKVIIGIFVAIGILALFIYVPPFFYKETSDNSYVPVMPDATAIKTYQTYLKDNPDMDFDEDGMTNAMESDYGTNVWNVDTDGDGVDDYAELFVTETSPTDQSSIMVKQVSAEDDRKGANLGTPYKLDDIIFWPDSYQAKAYGAVVKLSQTDKMIAYRFCYYNGWVRFPFEGAYAYGYSSDGIHYDLKYRSAENAWKIENSDEVRLYPAPLEFINCLELPFVGKVYLEDGGFGDFLTEFLPHKGGFVTCHRAATIDEDPTPSNDVTATLRQPFYDKSDPTRFGKNMNSLKDLSWLRKVIDAGHCVAASLYDGSTGEAIVIVYGYTQDGDLLVANENLEPVGKIYVTEMAMRAMNKEGTIGFRSWYEWKGLGFDSYRYGDRISFFASTLTEAESGAMTPETQDTGVVGEKSGQEDAGQAPAQSEQAQTQVQSETASQRQPAEQPAEQPATQAETSAPASQSEVALQPAEQPLATEAGQPTDGQEQPNSETEASDSVITFGF